MDGKYNEILMRESGHWAHYELLCLTTAVRCAVVHIDNGVNRTIMPSISGVLVFLRFQPFALFVAIQAVAIPTFCQNNSCLQRTVLVSAMKNPGAPIPELNAKSFDARIASHKVSVTALTAAPTNRRGVLLLDMSASMAGDPPHDKWPAALAVANEIVSGAPSTISLGMIAFSDKTTDEVTLGDSSRAEISSRLNSYQTKSPAGRTPLLDGIDRAIRTLTPVQPGDEIYLISDTGDNYSKATFDPVRARLLTSEIRLHLIYIRESPITSTWSAPRPHDQPYTFSSLALESGGWALDVPATLPREKQQVRELISAVVDAMVSDRLLQLQIALPQQITKLRRWDLAVLDEHGRRNKNLMLLYPHSLAPLPCSSSSP